MQYKTVAAPIGYEIKMGDKDGCAKVISEYAALIQKKTVGGWEFHSIQEILVTEVLGCFGKLLKKAACY